MNRISIWNRVYPLSTKIHHLGNVTQKWTLHLPPHPLGVRALNQCLSSRHSESALSHI